MNVVLIKLSQDAHMKRPPLRIVVSKGEERFLVTRRRTGSVTARRFSPAKENYKVVRTFVVEDLPQRRDIELVLDLLCFAIEQQLGAEKRISSALNYLAPLLPDLRI